MGNFHCIPSDCARVLWREYLPPVVRWRYEGEDWNEIEADDYTIIEGNPKFEGGQCPGVRYKLQYWNLKAVGNNSYNPLYRNPSNTIYTDSYIFKYPIVDIELTYKGNVISYEEYKRNGKKYTQAYNLRVYVYLNENNPRFFLKAYGFLNSWGIEPKGFIPLDPEPDNCTDCIFTIINNGQKIHEETRSSCPEVEQIPCRLSDIYQEIKIEKSAYLERVEVRNQDINLTYVSPLEAPLINVSSLPENCLNIYNTYTLAPPLLSNFVPLPGAINPYQYVTQICSAPDCPPPEYEVICDCGKECPDGTCPIVCGETVCCADLNTGHTVESIPLSEYGGEL